MVESHDLSNQEILLLVGNYPIRQHVHCEKKIDWMTFGSWTPDVEGSLWLMASATSGGGTLWLKASMIGESGPCPF
jgi:hypothetical protein